MVWNSSSWQLMVLPAAARTFYTCLFRKHEIWISKLIQFGDTGLPQNANSRKCLLYSFSFSGNGALRQDEFFEK
jgi:hypothetical protein